MSESLEPVHPGEILREEFLVPGGVSPARLAGELKIPLDALEAVLDGRAPVTSDLSVGLAAFLGTSAQFWRNLQSRWEAERKRRVV